MNCIFILPHTAEMHKATRLIPGYFADNKIKEINDVKMNENDMTNKVRKGQVYIPESSPGSFID